MTISTNSVITYNDLITSTVTYIYQRCQNSATMVSGYVNGTHPSDWNNKVVGTSPKTVKATMTVSDNIVSSISTTTIRNELENFLKGRNLYVATNTEISHKSLINYISNIAAFVCAKMVRVVNPMSTEPNGYLVYVSGNAVVVGVNNIVSQDLLNSELQSNITSIANVNSLLSNIHTINMNLAYNCSSSSSSCSSSSCSSSSSLFIAYMNLN